MAARRRRQVQAADFPTDGFRPVFFDDERHHEALEQLAVDSLSAGNARAAFKYADRRCRINPLAQAHHYTLRAEASYQMEERDAALLDISRALELLPEDLVANRRMLAWGEDAQQLKAAHVLLRREHDYDVLAAAITLLRKGAKPAATFAAVQHTEDSVYGWAAWSKRGPLKLTVSNGNDTIRTRIDADAKHRLSATVGHAANFTIARPLSRLPQHVSLSVGGKPFHQLHLPPNDKGLWAASPSRTVKPEHPAPSGVGTARDASIKRLFGAAAPLTVIVPIYQDYNATKDCLDSLLAELETHPQATAILVNDASPEARIRKYLVTLSKRTFIQVLTNTRNLGFVRSVNLALAQVPAGDVILLNADTIVPPGFMARLQSAARSAPNIGTVVPLSNNGEFTSFPSPNKSNPITSPRDIVLLDTAAAAANPDKVIDIPNGTGFCLYVTRQCLNAVGGLSDIFDRGYLEDADFCLRAREKGFRNVCAPSIYVGHVGSRSFGDEKRSLVMRNMGKLEARFRDYRTECAMFVKADPLKSSRASIERLNPSLNEGAVLLISGAGAYADVVKARARQLAKDGISALIVESHPFSPNPAIQIAHPSGGIPQSLSFEIAQRGENNLLADYLVRLRPSRIEIAEPACVSDGLLDLLLALKTPMDFLIVDGGLICPRGTCHGTNGERCVALDGLPCARCLPAPAVHAEPLWTESWRSRWRELARRAEHIYAPSAQAGAFARHILSHPRIVELERREASPVIAARPRDDARVLGLLALGSSAADLRLIRQVARTLKADRPDGTVVVIGQTLDDLELMKDQNVFVTGPVGLDDLGRVLRQYGISAVFAAVRRPLFGHPAIDGLAANAGVPMALFDWSFGQVPAGPANLALDPAASDQDVASSIQEWSQS